MADLISSLFGIPAQQGIATALGHMANTDPAQAQASVNPVDQARVPIDPMTALQIRSNMDSAERDSHKYHEESGKHKGVAGVARNILGTLGDFLLTRLHMKPMYWPGEEDRKLQAAWQGHDQDQQAALDRVTDVNYGAGQSLANTLTDNARLAAQQQSTDEYRKTREQDLAFKQQQITRKGAASYLGALDGLSPDKQAENYSRLRPFLLKTYGRTDPDLATMLPEAWTDDTPLALNALFDGAVPLSAQRAQKQAALHEKHTYELGTGNLNERVRHNQTTEGIGQQNADTNANRATETGRHNGVTEQQAANNETDKVVLKTVDMTDKRNHNKATEPTIQVRKAGDGKRYKFKLVNKDWVNIGPAD